MDKIRILYEQLERSIWCSHLDTMRTLQRVMNRASVPIRYSEGFNPHAMISILMPLSVGQESVCQIAEIRVREDIDLSALPERLTAVMPEGFRVLDCYENGAKPAELKWLRVSGTWEYDTRDTSSAAAALNEFFSHPVEVMRKTKRGEGLFPLTEHISDVVFTPQDRAVSMTALVSCNEPVVNPELFTAAIAQKLPDLVPDGIRYRREEIFSQSKNIFR